MVVIAFLEVLAASLLSSKLNYFVFLALFLVFAVATFASWEIRRGGAKRVVSRRSGAVLSWRLAGLTVTVSLGILIFTAGLFFLLPRTARAAFERFVPERYHLTAFSNRVSLGEIGEVKRQGTVLMHVRIENVEGLVHLKWRGNALSEFDGKHWFNARNLGEPLRVRNTLLQLVDDDKRRRPGRRLNYEVRLKSFASDTLFIAGDPEFLRIDSPLVIRTATDGFRAGAPSEGVLRYGVYAYMDGPLPVEPAPTLTSRERSAYLALPRLDPRVKQLAERITAGYSSPYDKARELERRLQIGYRYTLQLPKREAEDPIAQFLFERREGHCEYFASAMAVMLRTLGIPSRVATGFQSGTYNPISGWHVIRASDAHSWVEAFLPESGWTTFDPTPPDPSGQLGGVWQRLGLFLDAADTFWQEWILNYDLNRQLVLASRVERSGRRFSVDWAGELVSQGRELGESAWAWLTAHSRMLLAMLAALATISLAIPRARNWWKGRERIRRLTAGHPLASDATLMYLRALELLERRGYIKPAWLGPGEFVQHLPSQISGIVRQLTTAYVELRFGDHPEAAADLVQSLRELEEALATNR